MAVSKRLRFEILRRDNHACRYCGAVAPDVRLTVDHVVPTALGGSDEPANLVACCMPCNSGKSSASPDAPVVADVSADALRWARAMEAAADAMLADLRCREETRDKFLAKWNSWTAGVDKITMPLPGDWGATVDRLLATGLPLPLLLECVDIAMGASKIPADKIFRYLCGVAWRRIGELQEAARNDVGEPAVEANPAAIQHYYPLLDVLNEAFLDELLQLLDLDSSTRRLASECMFYAAEAGNARWIEVVTSDAEYGVALGDARAAAKAAATPFLSKIVARVDRLGVAHGQD